uniref:hypothetical protein n=1 Tax=Stomatohabitans albus TaxID=3110766 RepID=UPI00300D6C1C
TYVNDALCKVVADKQGAAVKNVMLADGQAILPLKVTPSDLQALVGDEKKAPNRVYEVADAKADIEYTIKLAKGKKDEKGNIVLDLGTDERPQDFADAKIAVVNGAASGADNNVKVRAVAGKISFSVEANKKNGSGYVIPIVTAVEDAKDKLVGMGGPIHISPQAAENGKYLGQNENKTDSWTVESVDKQAKTLVLVSQDGATKRTIVYKANDTIHRDNTSPGSLVSFDEFTKELSKGDKFVATAAPGGTLYYSAPSLASTLVWVDAAPVAPAIAKSDKDAPTQNTITLKLTGVEDGANVTVKAFKIDNTNPNGLAYKGNEEKFTITRNFPAVKLLADKTVEVKVTGLDADSKYDFAVSQTVGEEVSDFGDFGNAGGNDVNTHVLQTTKQPEALAIANIERVDDVINDGDAASNTTFKVTLSSDSFDDGDIVDFSTAGNEKMISIEAKTGGTVYATSAGSTNAAADKKVGKEANSKVFYFKVNTPLKDAVNDIEYTVKFQQGVVTTTAAKGQKPSSPAEFKFSYR